MKKLLTAALIASAIASAPLQANPLLPMVVTTISSIGTASDFVMNKNVIEYTASTGLEIQIHHPERGDDNRLLVLDRSSSSVLLNANLKAVELAATEYANTQGVKVKLKNPESYYYSGMNGYAFEVEVSN